MAEDEETATARYIASNVSTQLMLKSLFELIAMEPNDPDGFPRRYGNSCWRSWTPCRWPRWPRHGRKKSARSSRRRSEIY